ncbi:MAG TPA: YedE-related selenium metabolism membrane protein [Chloroflexi bacterium]|nr:YedE-related selenium metabolism membrane protein [Chloroflexota bacterium]
MSRLWTPRTWIILGGLALGTLATLLTKWGNPPNMGICVACFVRDIAGALGLHQAGVVQYLRPEIMGFLLGAFASARAFGEFRSRGGSSPIIRFFLAMFLMVGALVFLGCPIRALVRLAGGDLNGIPALGGLVFGVFIGIQFLKRGYTLGRSGNVFPVAGWIMPLCMVALLLLALFNPRFILTSTAGPGSLYAPLWISLLVGLFVGFIAQRTRMCSVGAWRDLILIRDTHLFSGVVAFFIAALVSNYALGNFSSGLYHWGFEGQYVAHTDHLWSFLGMTLVGLTATFLGGCPLRQIILSGEGDVDASTTVLGLIAGGAIAHNFLLASSPNGVSAFGPLVVVLGLVFTLTIGFLMREKT